MISIVALSIVFAFLATRSSADDLAPKNTRWQIYPSNVRDVAFDKNLKPWLMLKDHASLEEIKKRVETAASEESPYVAGAKILLFLSLIHI